ncbi:MAG TPA: PqqD family protein [Solirubrobacteraceae bacterium]|nr:PqqD family protein [Solirubrobacteraceae bacterium]
MTATAEPPASAAQLPRGEVGASAPWDRARGIELLGCVHGCGYRDRVSLVRRADGQIVQLGPLLYGLLECIDGRRDVPQLAEALSEQIKRKVESRHVVRLLEKLRQQGLLAGTEHRAPPKRNPLLALRWKVLVTNPRWTRRLTAPLAFLFRPWIMWPVVAAFAAVFWFVLIQKGIASATAQAFHQPALLLLVFLLAVASAGIHELGHAAACKYGGATPGGMGMGIYLVWPAFYTDVTETYKLPKRARLRVDLAGLYFNALIADLTMAVWLVVRTDALLLLVALQVLQMVKQLSPVIRADGYHILSDATGVPDLFAHIGPTLRRLLPKHRHEPSALNGRARAIVTIWVLIVVPVLLSLMIGAVLVLPRVATSAWDSGRAIALSMPSQVHSGQIINLLASAVELLALILPLLGSLLVTQKVLRMSLRYGRSWSRGSLARGAIATVAGLLMMSGVAWAWWPSGQYQPVPRHGGTIASLARAVAAPGAAARPQPSAPLLTPGTHLAISMIPIGGATAQHPALHVILGGRGGQPVAILGGGAGGPAAATAFRFHFSGSSRTDSSAIALTRKRGAVTYNVAYSLVTVSRGAPVTERNTAIAISHCRGCSSVAVSFQVVLVVGQSNVIAPINNAYALNYHCPSCAALAMADQMVITLKQQPPRALVTRLRRALARLHQLSKLRGRFALRNIVAAVGRIQRQIETALVSSGLMTNPPRTSSTAATSTTTSPQSGSSAPVGGSTQTTQSSSTTSSLSTNPVSSSTTSPSTNTTTTTTSATTTGSSSSTTTTGGASSSAS